VPADLVEIGFDPQTSGGLLAALPVADAAGAVQALRAAGVASATIVGAVEERRAGAWITLR
jgi:selenide,water dikinase